MEMPSFLSQMNLQTCLYCPSITQKKPGEKLSRLLKKLKLDLPDLNQNKAVLFQLI
jgi:hypothetical protein